MFQSTFLLHVLHKNRYTVFYFILKVCNLNWVTIDKIKRVKGLLDSRKLDIKNPKTLKLGYCTMNKEALKKI